MSSQNSQEITIRSQSQADFAVMQITDKWQAALNSGQFLQVVIKVEENKRSIAQNRMLHSMLGDLEKQVKWHGQSFSAAIWKRLTVASYFREHGEKPLLVPALDGYGVDIIYEKTSKMNIKTCRELIEWIAAFGTEHNVNWTKYGKVNELEW